VATGAKRDELIQAMIEATGPDAPSLAAYEEMVARIDEAARKIKADGGQKNVGLMEMGDEAKSFPRYGSIRFVPPLSQAF